MLEANGSVTTKFYALVDTVGLWDFSQTCYHYSVRNALRSVSTQRLPVTIVQLNWMGLQQLYVFHQSKAFGANGDSRSQ